MSVMVDAAAVSCEAVRGCEIVTQQNNCCEVFKIFGCITATGLRLKYMVDRNTDVESDLSNNNAVILYQVLFLY